MCWGLQAFLGPSGLNSGWCRGDPCRGSRGGMLETTGADSPAAEAVDGQEAAASSAGLLRPSWLHSPSSGPAPYSFCCRPVCSANPPALPTTHRTRSQVPHPSASMSPCCPGATVSALLRRSPSLRMLPHPPQHGPLLPARPPLALCVCITFPWHQAIWAHLSSVCSLYQAESRSFLGQLALT